MVVEIPDVFMAGAVLVVGDEGQGDCVASVDLRLKVTASEVELLLICTRVSHHLDKGLLSPQTIARLT